MNIPFLTKPNIKVYTEFPQIADQYPIYSSREYKRSWVKECARAFIRYKERINKTKTLITASKCPGIRSVREKGYILQSWFDFTIETTEKDFQVYYPTNLENHLKEIGYTNPLISSFDTRYSPVKIPIQNNLPHIIKIWTPYCLEIPKNYELLILPIQYSDNDIFTACSGSITGFEIDFNVHVYWHKINQKVHVPAGTPLCQLVPIRKDQISLMSAPINNKIQHEISKRKLKKFNRFEL